MPPVRSHVIADDVKIIDGTLVVCKANDHFLLLFVDDNFLAGLQNQIDAVFETSALHFPIAFDRRRDEFFDVRHFVADAGFELLRDVIFHQRLIDRFVFAGFVIELKRARADDVRIFENYLLKEEGHAEDNCMIEKLNNAGPV